MKENQAKELLNKLDQKRYSMKKTKQGGIK